MDNPRMTYVTMTKEHFLRGEPCSKFECAFALALDEHLKEGFVSGVTKSMIFFHEEGDGFSIVGKLVASTATPRRVRAFIKKYDEEDPEDTFALPLRTRVRMPAELLA